MNHDLAFVLVGLAAGLSPFLLGNLRGAGRSRAAGLGLLVVSIAALAFGVLQLRALRTAPPARLGGPHEVAEDGYVGSGVCQSCHPDRHASWHASYHRTMTQWASPDSIQAPFDGTELDLEGATWRVERRGDEFWVTGRPTGDSRAGPPTVEKRVVMATGSHNYQLYWLDSPDGLEQFPLVYLLYDQTWIPRKSRFLTPPVPRTPNETGRWRAHCIKCHATRGRKEDLPSGETRVAELGIACEACHGPGARHVAANHSPLYRYRTYLGGGADPTIVNPARLSHERSTEVCGQCHSIEIFLTQDKAMDWIHTGTHYRPGDVLSRYQTTVVGRYDDNPPEVQDYLDRHPGFRLRNCFWPDGMLRVAGREYHGMLETPCFQRGEMSCLSCHKMHPSADDPARLASWAEDQLGKGKGGDRACLPCHAKFESPEARVAHSHHKADSTGNLCYNCHMPYTTWGLLRGIRSHTVDSPDVATTLATGRPNACNQCHLDRTLQWTAETLQKWYGTEPPELSEDERTIAASVLWALRGDAVQRALMAWSMGWKPAREISGTDWMVPYLCALMLDPYDAVRFNAQRTLRLYPDLAAAAATGAVGPTKEEQSAIMDQVLGIWNRRVAASSGKFGAQLLFRPEGGMDLQRMAGLTAQRDDQDLVLFE